MGHIELAVKMNLSGSQLCGSPVLSCCDAMRFFNWVSCNESCVLSQRDCASVCECSDLATDVANRDRHVVALSRS